MKAFNYSYVVAFVILILCGCQKKESPTEPSFLAKGEYIGTFNVTFKNYQNYSEKVTQSGSITFLFSGSSYQYSGTVVYNSFKDTSFGIGDHGVYNYFDDKIIMTDISGLLMDPRWHNSLYLSDTFSIRTVEQQFVITQDNSFAMWELKLNSK